MTPKLYKLQTYPNKALATLTIEAGWINDDTLSEAPGILSFHKSPLTVPGIEQWSIELDPRYDEPDQAISDLELWIRKQIGEVDNA